MERLDHQELYLGVLETIRPQLAETIRLETATAGRPVEIVVAGDAHQWMVRDLAGVSQLGRIIIDNDEDGGAAIAAAAVTQELMELFARTNKGRAALERDRLFHELLSELNPSLADMLDLETEISGGAVSVKVDGEGDGDDPGVGVVSLAAGEDSESVKAAHDLTDRLYDLYHASLSHKAEPVRERWLRRLWRRRSD